MKEKNPTPTTVHLDVEEDLLFADHPMAHTDHIMRAIQGKPVLIHLSKGQERKIATEDCYAFLIPIEGEILLEEPPYEEHAPSKQEIFLLNYYTEMTVKPVDEEVRFLLITFHPSIQLCVGICPKIKGSCSSGKKEDNESALPMRSEIKRLSIKPAVRSWTELVAYYLIEGHSGLPIYEYKLRELFHIFRRFYNNEDLSAFLASFHCKHHGFRAFVYNHHLECRNVEELAALLEMSLSSFKRAFKAEFNCAPLQWMHKQKAAYIYRDLREQRHSLSELAIKYHFSSVSYLCAFCKKMLNATPMQISHQTEKETEQ